MSPHTSYLAIMSSFGPFQDPRQQVYLEMLLYLDDHHCPVRVRLHERLPAWLRSVALVSSFVYFFRLACARKAVVLIDGTLYLALGLALPLVRLMRRHRLVVSAVGIDPPEGGGLAGWIRWLCWQACFRSADRVLVGSRQAVRDFAGCGVPRERIGVVLAGGPSQPSSWPPRPADGLALRLVAWDRDDEGDTLALASAVRDVPGLPKPRLILLRERGQGPRPRDAMLREAGIHIVEWRYPEDKRQVYLQSDGCVLPTIGAVEDLLMSEAAQSGLPAVTGVGFWQVAPALAARPGVLWAGESGDLASSLRQLAMDQNLLSGLAAALHPSHTAPRLAGWRKARKRFASLLKAA